MATENAALRAANTAQLERNLAKITANVTYIKAKLKAHEASMATKLTNAETTRSGTITTARKKLERNTIRVQQAKVKASRLKTANHEQHLAQQRSLYASQTAMQNRLDTARNDIAKTLTTENANIDKLLYTAKFDINQVKTPNGPTVKIADLKKESCTTDQFGKVTCTSSSSASDFVSSSTYSAYTTTSTPR